MNTPAFRLYAYYRSSASWRVRTVLALKQIPYEYVPVNLVRDGGEQHLPAYEAKNPLRQVPTLEWEEAGETRRLTQSLAIISYLDALVSTPPIVPRDPFLAAAAWEIAEIVNAGIQPLQNLFINLQLKAAGLDEIAWSRRAIHRGLDAIEQRLGEHAARASFGPHALGADVTIADVCLVPQVYNARRFGVDLSGHPRVLEVEAACRAHPAFRASDPAVQPDAPAPPPAVADGKTGEPVMAEAAGPTNPKLHDVAPDVGPSNGDAP